MKKILIIEDDQVVANIYRNKFVHEGFQVETSLDGETGLDLLKSFRPDLVVLDLMLPKMSGIDVLKQIRSNPEAQKVPVIVFSNTYLSNMVQDAWKAGANKCISKSNCTPKHVLDVVRSTLGEPNNSKNATDARSSAAANQPASTQDAEFQSDLRRSFIESLPSTLAILRALLQNLVRSDSDAARLKHIHELYRKVHVITGNAAIAGMSYISQMADALEALLKELHEKPRNINASTLRTVAYAIDFLGVLFENSDFSGTSEVPNAKVLVVDDEIISRRAVTYALDKAKLQSVGVEKAEDAYKLLQENAFDLIFLDVDMPEMNGFELCAKLRNLPQHLKTPVVFVTSLNDFENRAQSTVSGGNDFIGKPFLFIELAVKALVHLLRARLDASKQQRA